MQGLLRNLPRSEAAKKANEQYEKLESLRRQRYNEEAGRREDQKAVNTDTSRARNPATLDPEEGVTINRTYQVKAKDIFSLHMQHSSGQRMGCEVELILRYSPYDRGNGDLLICEQTDSSAFLLFPPQDRWQLSARLGENEKQIVVLMRGSPIEWRETFVLEADDAQAASEWIEMLGQSPVPPPITYKKMELDAELASVIEDPDLDTKSVVGALKAVEKNDIPIGERLRREAEVTIPKVESKKTPSRYHQRSSSQSPYASRLAHVRLHVRPDQIERLMDPNDMGILDVKQIEHELRRSGKARLPPHNKVSSSDAYDPTIAGPRNPDYTGFVEMSGAHDPYPGEVIQKAEVLVSSTEATAMQPNEPLSPGHNVLKKQQPSTATRDDSPPPPPAHKSPVTPESLRKTPVLDPATPKAKNRRTSSPLKHEWQPSDASGTSSCSEDSSSSDDSYTDESSDEELEAAALPEKLAAGVSLNGRKISPNGSIDTADTSSLAPSNSASQGPYNAAAQLRQIKDGKRFVAMVSYWHRNQWVDISAEPCSIAVTPGHIEVFRMNSSHSSSPTRSSNAESSSSNSRPNSNENGVEVPIVEQVLVPWASLRQSNALDVEIGSPPTGRSQLDKLKDKSRKIFQFRYRTLNTNDGHALYAACDHSRMNNPHVLEMQRQNALDKFGSNAYENAIAANRRRSIFGISFGRKKSYRASAREPSDYESDPSGRTSSSAMSALRRMAGGGAAFNIAKSTLDLHARPSSNPSSGPQSLYSSDSGITPPRTPTSPSLAGGSSMYSNGLTVRDIGFENIPIQLYNLVNSATWNDCGKAFFTCVAPPRGMRQSSTLDHGPQKRIIVSRKPLNMDPDGNAKQNVIFLDAVLGRDCFKKQGRVGVICSVWEDVVGDDGKVGFVKAFGGVGARTRVWAFQLGRAGDCEWVYQLCTSGQGR